MTHTPGPWAYEQESDNGTDYWIFQANGPARIAVEVSERDAALIAAAPELLAALQRIVRAADRMPINSPLDGIIDEARAAIARATGP